MCALRHGLVTVVGRCSMMLFLDPFPIWQNIVNLGRCSQTFLNRTTFSGRMAEIQRKTNGLDDEDREAKFSRYYIKLILCTEL